MNFIVKFSATPQTLPVKMDQEASITGVSDHRLLSNRDSPDAHPISAITGLAEALEECKAGGKAATDEEVQEMLTEIFGDE